MTWLDTIIKIMISVFGISFFQLAISNFLPAPISYIHVPLISVILILFLYEHGSIIWLSAIWFFMMETLAITPFGIVFFSGIFATMFVYILYREVFTNRSLYSAIILFSISYVLFRLWYMFLFSIYALNHSTIHVPFSQFFHVFALEWLVSTITLIILYFVVRLFSQQLQRQRIEESWFKKLGA